MREIKFRGLRTDNQEWIYGYYFVETKHLIMPRHKIINKWTTKEVHSTTVCQYTGLKDKNGVDIYEGDEVILRGKAKGDNKGIVIYSDKACKFAVRIYRKGYWQKESHLLSIINSEVTGNIFEKPLISNNE